MPVDTIPQRLFDRAAAAPDSPAYYSKVGGAWVPTGYRRYAEQVKHAGKALMALGCAHGSSVAILGANRPEWVVADLACMAIGGAPAGIYATSSPVEARYIVNHTESPVVFVDSDAQWQKIRAERANLPNLRWIVTMRGAVVNDPQVLSWDAFVARGEAIPDAAFFERIHALEPGGIAALIYTSGTTGPPKGVMLSHANVAFAGTLAIEIASLGCSDRLLSYLPLSHIAEQIFSLYGPLTAGSAIYFAESIDHVPANLREVRPTVFFGVPRIWEKFHAAIAAKLATAGGARKRVAAWALGVGQRASAYKMRGERLPLALEAQYRVANKVFFLRLKQAIGLDRGRLFVSGAAPIAREILEFFAALDIVVHEGYGQSENAGGTSINRPGRVKLGSVGVALPGVEAKIADDGEILARGPNVFLGYYKDPAATADALVEGWLHSGDLGVIDADGFVSITGRKKDLIITAGGKNVAPTNIEAALKNHALVSEVVVIGDRRKHLTALVTLDAEAGARFREERGLDRGRPLHTDPAVVSEVQRALDAVNADMARVEQVKKFVILPSPFSIETGELTATLKVKRKLVEEKFSAEIESMYQD
jgi:long-chain acyl-CoA synthetase